MIGKAINAINGTSRKSEQRVGKQQINIYDYENKNVIDHFGDFMEFGANN